jgi:hypothetical protein
VCVRVIAKLRDALFGDNMFSARHAFFLFGWWSLLVNFGRAVVAATKQVCLGVVIACVCYLEPP